MKVLIVDDESDVCETVKECLEGGLPGVDVVIECDFGNALTRLREFRPDVLVLDWYQGALSMGVEAGRDAWEEVWNSWFCAVVLYSAGEVEIGTEGRTHPFVRVVTKGSDSASSILRELREFELPIRALNGVSEDLAGAARSVMRSIAPMIFDAESDAGVRSDMLNRATRRRLAAMFDDSTLVGGAAAHAWEQYVFPVFTSHVVMGDVLRKRGAAVEDPTSYRLVLTPTCDLVPYGRPPTPKAREVLCARCCTTVEFVEKGLSLGATTAVKKVEERMQSAVNEPHQGGYALLPACSGARIPAMAANLRDLELVDGAVIAGGDGPEGFDRVASVDSPYRERLAWAYLEIGCRPGVPGRDMRGIIEDTVQAWQAKGQAQGQ